MRPREYQSYAVECIFNFFKDNEHGHPLIALPTGTGKSLVIAEFCRQALTRWPDTRIIVLTHDKELVSQDTDKILKVWPLAPVGVYSAGLRRRDTAQPIIVGGIGSVAKCPEKFGRRDIVIIDEAHRIAPNEDTIYRKTLSAFEKLNSNVRFVGLSATIFRMRQGYLTENSPKNAMAALFTDICCDATGIDAFLWFISEGYLAPLVPLSTDTVLPVGGVSIRAGEYAQGELQKAVDKDDITEKAMREMVDKGQDRESWLVFTTGVEHAEHTAEALQRLGVEACALHSKIPPKQRDAIIADYKLGKIRCLVTKDMLTTGFDHPRIDLIGVLRPSRSPGLWVQILGRGTRPVYAPGHDLSTRDGRLAAIRAGGKLNCMVLDFANNTQELGPINDPRIPRPPGQSTGDVPVKVCPICRMYNSAAARFCGGGSSAQDAVANGGCGAEFNFQVKYDFNASTKALIRTKEPIIERKTVNAIWYSRHEKEGRNPSMKVTYVCGLKSFCEWICFEHVGLPYKTACNWWRQRSHGEVPCTDEAIRIATAGDVRQPKAILVNTNTQYGEITDYEF